MEHKVTPKIRVRCEASLVKLVAKEKRIISSRSCKHIKFTKFFFATNYTNFHE